MTDSNNSSSSSSPLTLSFQSKHELRELLPQQPRVSVSVEKDHYSLHQQHDLQPLATVSLAERLVGDVLIAAAVTACAAPFLTIVDKALVERAAGSKTLMASARGSVAGMLSNPITYFKSPTFLWMWATYAATYSAINSLRTITEQQEYQALSTGDKRRLEQQKRTTTATLFVGTTLVNSSASMVKDRAYAKLFGSAVQTAVPKSSYLLWMARDCTVISSSFLLPSHVSQLLQHQAGFSQEQATKIAQIGTPMVAQLVAGPLHFVGLDCFSRPLSNHNILSTLVNRTRYLKDAYLEVVGARMLRILPGYGIAGVYNTNWRNAYRNYLIEKKVRAMMTSEAAAATTTSTITITTSLPTQSVHLARKDTAPGELVALIRAKTTMQRQKSTATTPSS